MLVVLVGPWASLASVNDDDARPVGRRRLCPLRSITTLHNKSYGRSLGTAANGYDVASCLWPSMAFVVVVYREADQRSTWCEKRPRKQQD